MTDNDVKQLVRGRYGQEARRVLSGAAASGTGDAVLGLRRDARLWAGCFAGTLTESDYRARLRAAGFTGIQVRATHAYGEEEAHEFPAFQGVDADRFAPQVAGKVISAFVRAVKP